MGLIDEAGAKAIQGWLPKRTFDPVEVILSKAGQMIVLTARSEQELAVLKMVACNSDAKVEQLVPLERGELITMI